MKSFTILLESAINCHPVADQPIEEMAIRAGSEHKAYITRWDNASWESFYGDFDKMKSNSKKYTTKNDAFNASIIMAQKKVDAGKSKVTVDDAMTGNKVWTAGDMKAFTTTN